VTDWSLYEDADGMEIYNVHATFAKKAKDKTFPIQVMKAIKEDPEHSFRLLQELDFSVLKQWERMNLKKRFTGVAGNDSHQNMAFFGLQLDPYPRAFKFVTTHVQAEELTQGAILDAIRKGRAAVAFELHYPVEIVPDKPGSLRSDNPAGAMAFWGAGLARYDAWSYQLEGDFVLPWVLFNPSREQ
jgi:hypothetical protein